MADLQIEWRGLTIGAGGDYHVEEIAGWDDLPEIASYDTPRSRGHGHHTGDQFAGARIVTASGTIASPAARDALALALASASPVSSVVEDLTVRTLGRSLSAGARLIRRSLPVTLDYAAGVIPFALQWKCPDPLRYGPLLTSSTVGLPTSGGGLAYPLAYGLDYGSAGTPGQITLTNAGTADASITFTVTGELPAGFEISSEGRRLVYPAAIPPGQVLVLDTGAGTAVLEGTSDRRADLTVADWFLVPAGSSVTVQFASLGGAYDAAATLTASMRSAWW